MRRKVRVAGDKVTWQYVLFLFTDAVLRTTALVPAFVYYIAWGFSMNGGLSFDSLLLVYTALMLLCTARPVHPSRKWLVVFVSVVALVVLHFTVDALSPNKSAEGENSIYNYIPIVIFVIIIWSGAVAWITRNRDS